MIFAQGWNVRSECGKAGQPDRCRWAGIFSQYFVTISSEIVFSQYFVTISSAFSHNIIRVILISHDWVRPHSNSAKFKNSFFLFLYRTFLDFFGPVLKHKRPHNFVQPLFLNYINNQAISLSTGLIKIIFISVEEVCRGLCHQVQHRGVWAVCADEHERLRQVRT